MQKQETRRKATYQDLTLRGPNKKNFFFSIPKAKRWKVKKTQKKEKILTENENQVNDLEPGLKEVVRVYKTVKAVDNSRTSDDVLADNFTKMIPAGDQTANNCW